jgi:hypothetical protein
MTLEAMRKQIEALKAETKRGNQLLRADNSSPNLYDSVELKILDPLNWLQNHTQTKDPHWREAGAKSPYRPFPDKPLLPADYRSASPRADCILSQESRSDVVLFQRDKNKPTSAADLAVRDTRRRKAPSSCSAWSPSRRRESKTYEGARRTVPVSD